LAQRKAYLNKNHFSARGEGISGWRNAPEVVGTMAQRSTSSQSVLERQSGLFGFFDVLAAITGYSALWDQACSWAKKRNLTELIIRTALQLMKTWHARRGFQYPPAIMMGHNPAYYPQYAKNTASRSPANGSHTAMT
jgi:hypothetical protein